MTSQKEVENGSWPAIQKCLPATCLAVCIVKVAFQQQMFASTDKERRHLSQVQVLIQALVGVLCCLTFSLEVGVQGMFAPSLLYTGIAVTGRCVQFL